MVHATHNNMGKILFDTIDLIKYVIPDNDFV